MPNLVGHACVDAVYLNHTIKFDQGTTENRTFEL